MGGKLKPPPSQNLYPALHRLERQKLIKGEWKITDNGRRARYYRLTPTGSKHLSGVEGNWAMLIASVGKVLRHA
jgi:DNA-binding PadR family transcriptional regulator